MSQLHEAQRRADPIRRYVAPESLEDALAVLAAHGSAARAVAGGTDLLLELSRGARSGIDTLVDLSVLDGLDAITESGGRIELGPLVTHGDVVGTERMLAVGLPLAQACLEVGGPQLRNRATVVGNIVTASPANDTISALYALGADVTLASASGGERSMPIQEFLTGFRTTALRPGELVTKIAFDALGETRRGIFVKLGLRRVQAISVVHAAAVVTVAPDGTVADLAGGSRQRRTDDRTRSRRPPGSPEAVGSLRPPPTSRPRPGPRSPPSTTCARQPSTAATPLRWWWSGR